MDAYDGSGIDTWLALWKSGYEWHGVHGHVVQSDWNESIFDMAPI